MRRVDVGRKVIASLQKGDCLKLAGSFEVAQAHLSTLDLSMLMKANQHLKTHEQEHLSSKDERKADSPVELLSI